MGGSSYSDSFYDDRAKLRSAKGVSTFDYSAKVKTGTAPAKVHDSLNINGKVRESRDSAAHPESLAIAVIFDVTGSMGGVPHVFQQKIPQLMGLLLRKGYVEHPQVLLGAVGDWTSDSYPLQIGQFESGAETDDDINNVILEGGGGGSYQESYQLAMYYMAHRTSIDCFEKRGKKGYLFIIGDEKPYPSCKKDELSEVLGVTVQADVPIEAIVQAAQEKYNVYFVVPTQGTSHGTDPVLKKTWVELLGSQNVLMLENNDAVAELIATTVGVFEGMTDIDGVKKDLADVGSAHVVDAVTTALGPVAASAALARTGTGGIPESLAASGTARV